MHVVPLPLTESTLQLVKYYTKMSFCKCCGKLVLVSPCGKCRAQNWESSSFEEAMLQTSPVAVPSQKRILSNKRSSLGSSFDFSPPQDHYSPPHSSPPPLPSSTSSSNRHNRFGRYPKKHKTGDPLESAQFIQQELEKQSNFVAPNGAAKAKHLKTAENCFYSFLLSYDSSWEVLLTWPHYELKKWLLLWVHDSLSDGGGEGHVQWAMYSYDSFRDTYIPYLAQVLVSKSLIGQEECLEYVKIMRDHASSLSKAKMISKAQMPNQKAKHPCCYWDLEWMVQETPPQFLSNIEDTFAFFTLALQSGQRGISLANLKWKHIYHFRQHKDNDDTTLWKFYHSLGTW